MQWLAGIPLDKGDSPLFEHWQPNRCWLVCVPINWDGDF